MHSTFLFIIIIRWTAKRKKNYLSKYVKVNTIFLNVNRATSPCFPDTRPTMLWTLFKRPHSWVHFLHYPENHIRFCVTRRWTRWPLWVLYSTLPHYHSSITLNQTFTVYPFRFWSRPHPQRKMEKERGRKRERETILNREIDKSGKRTVVGSKWVRKTFFYF